MEDVSILHSLLTLRSSSGDHLRPDYRNHRNSSEDHLRSDERSAGPAHTLILISNPALESLLESASSNPPRVGTHSFSGHEPTVSPHPFAWQSNKGILFYCTSPKTLSPRFDSAPVHRGQVLIITPTSLRTVLPDSHHGPLISQGLSLS